MKRILYLDRDFMDSYIAQTGAGLPGQHTYTSANNIVDGTSTTNPSINRTVSGGLRFSALGMSGDANYGRTAVSETHKELSLVSDGTTEAVTLIPHDNDLEEVIEHSGARKNDSMDIGDFIIASGSRPFVYDVHDIVARLDDAAIDFIARKTADDKVELLNNPSAKQVEGERKRIIREETTALKEARTQLNMACKFAQFDVCIIIGNKLAPLKREWMRTSSKDMIFKYNSRLHLFGQVTRSQIETSKARNLNPIEQLNALFNGMWPQALQRMQIIPEDDYWIIDPMALYFE